MMVAGLQAEDSAAAGHRAPSAVSPAGAAGSSQPICSARATMMPAGPRR